MKSKRKSADLHETVDLSPGGHVTKRRTRSRPVSLELMGSPKPLDVPEMSMMPPPPPVLFTKGHSRQGSNTSVSEEGSPARMTVRPEFDRLASSATLFFGPSIAYPPKHENAKESESVANTTVTDTFSPDVSFTDAFPAVGDSFVFSVTDSPTSRTSSPRGQIPKKYKKPRDSGVALSDDEADELLRPVVPQLQTLAPSPAPQRLQVSNTQSSFQPSFSTSTSSEATLFDPDDSLVTPCHEPSMGSAWPSVFDTSADTSNIDQFIVKTLEAGIKDGGQTKKMPNTPQKKIKTAYLSLPVQRPWASAITNKTTNIPMFEQKMPAPRFDRHSDDEDSAKKSKPAAQISKKALCFLGYSKPRKSCPGDLKFPSVEAHRREPNRSLSSSSSSSGEMESPVQSHVMPGPRHRTYGDVGIGRPSIKTGISKIPGPSLLLRRTSSGAYSTSSESTDKSIATPSKTKTDGGKQ